MFLPGRTFIRLICYSLRGKQTKKEILPYPICSVVAVFKMLIRILNTLPSHIWDMAVFLFSVYSKSTVCENGESPEGYGFLGELKSKGLTFKLLYVVYT